MKKVNVGLGLFAFSALAIATAWYCPFKVPGGYTLDKETEYANASNVFRVNQSVMNANGSMRPNDTVTFQYQDGTVVTFTLGPTQCTQRCVWASSMPFDPNKPPQVKQGATPTGYSGPAMVIGVIPGYTMPPMVVYPTVTSQLYTPTVTVTQGSPAGSAVSIYFPDGTNGGGGGGTGTGTGGGGGGGGWNDCGADCPPIEML